MISIRELDRELSITYRPTMVGILGAVVLALGLVVLVLGLTKPRRVTLRCDGTTCVLEKVAVLRTTSVDVTGLRGANAEEKRRGSRDNVRLVLRADREIEMGAWTSRGDRNASAFRDAAAKIEAYVAGGSEGSLSISIGISQTIVLWMLAVTLLGIGGVLVAIFLTGSKVRVDGKTGEYRHGAQRGRISELVSVEARGQMIVGKTSDGREVRLLRAVGRKGTQRPELGPAADRIRTYLGAA